MALVGQLQTFEQCLQISEQYCYQYEFPDFKDFTLERKKLFLFFRTSF